jgi:hypothetical protein
MVYAPGVIVRVVEAVLVFAEALLKKPEVNPIRHSKSGKNVSRRCLF